MGAIDDAELWAWSGAWLVYGIALMVWGIRARERLLRLAALGVVGLVCAKVFLIDMSGLTGLWRVLSFLGLGDANVVSWGSMIGAGREYLRSAWYISAIPGFAIMLTALSLNLIGDALNDILNPRGKGAQR